jgi:hypothetical protein
MQVGLIKLIQSSKATMSLIILACSTTGLLLGKLDGTSFAAVVGTIGTIFMWTNHKVDMSVNGMPERGK